MQDREGQVGEHPHQPQHLFRPGLVVHLRKGGGVWGHASGWVGEARELPPPPPPLPGLETVTTVTGGGGTLLTVTNPHLGLGGWAAHSRRLAANGPEGSLTGKKKKNILVPHKRTKD